MIYSLIILEVVVSVIVFRNGYKAIKEPKEYQKDDRIIVSPSTNLDIPIKEIDEKTWYYKQYTFGKAMKAFSVINLFLIIPEVFYFSNIQQASSNSPSNVEAIFLLFILLPCLIYRLLANLYSKYKVSNYDPDDMLNTFNQEFETKIDDLKYNKEKERSQQEKIAIIEAQNQDYEDAIKKQQDLNDAYYKEYEEKKKILSNEQTDNIQNLLAQREKYRKLIIQYHETIDLLDQTYTLSKEVCEDIDTYRNNSYERTSEMKDKIEERKDQMLECYSQYKDALIKINHLYDEYQEENDEVISYIYNEREVMKDIEISILLSRHEIEDFAHFCREIRIKLLEDILKLYKKRNEVYQNISQILDKGFSYK